MNDVVLIDNDVVLKISCYSLGDEFVKSCLKDTSPAMLGVGRFVVRNRLERSARIRDPKSAKIAFETLLGAVSYLEPDEAELALAADLEKEANLQNLELDGGESQLLAMLEYRTCQMLITGDKRAIRAVGIICAERARERVACLEQVLAQLVQSSGISSTRPKICAEPMVDQAASICFGCKGKASNQEEVLAALQSYTTALRREAPGVLLPGNTLRPSTQ